MSLPKKNPGLLFVVNGLGMGNSTRCYSVIQEMCRRYHVDIDVATSVNGLRFFADKPEIRTVYPMHSYNYGKKNGRLSMAATLGGIRNFLRCLIWNFRLLKSTLRETKPVGVVIDSEYACPPAWMTGIPVFAINNSDMVVRSFLKMRRRPASLWFHFLLVECMDLLFHCLVPDKVISPTLSTQIIKSRLKKIQGIAPIVRPSISPHLPRDGVLQIVIMLSSSAFGMNVNPEVLDGRYHFHIIGKEGMNTNHVTFCGRMLDNTSLLNRADVLVINGGFSAVSEAVVLKKPVIVVPVPNHAEQFVNARTIEDLGLGYTACEEDLPFKLQELVTNYHRILDGHGRFQAGQDGAAQAAACITGELLRRGRQIHARRPQALEAAAVT